MSRNKLFSAVIALTAFFCPSLHGRSNSGLQEIKDKIALRELVDRFSNLADEKNIAEQMKLFTDDAVVISMEGERTVSEFKGKQQIGEAFSNFLALFHTVYHINGQHTVKLRGNTATGTYYCQVALIAERDGKNMGRFSGVRYNDEYVKKNGTWFIKKRVSHFIYNDNREVK